MLRPANEQDIPKIEDIYDKLLTEEEQGRSTTGWIRGVYPTRAVAEDGVRAGDMVVLEEDGRVLAAARINHEQSEEYRKIHWLYPAPDDSVLVLHTLVVSPDAQGRGCARQIIEYYEETAAKRQCSVLRMDTNFRNERARAIYRKYGYRESGVVDCNFNGIPDVQMICMEKKLAN